MPALDNARQGDVSTLCKRCNEEQATLQIRSEQVCQKCFLQYVNTKAIKRMETYRVRGSTKTPKKLLLPLSFGPSSSSLLHILNQHLTAQYERMSRTAYELFVVHIDLFLDAADREESAALLEKYKACFPRHTYYSLGLEQALSLDDIDWKASDLAQPSIGDTSKPVAERLQEIIGSLPSSTSRTDVITTLKTRLLVDVAKRSGCEGILFGDSTTRLAEKSLTETAKGRGFSLPWQVSEGMSPYGITFNYPLRELRKKELVTFTSRTPPLTDLIIYKEPSSHISASSKQTTIDDLMIQYFESVEENYPSIVANVVRTSSKLKPLTGDDTAACGLCGLPVAEGTDGIFGWGGDQNSNSRSERELGQDSILCYGCSRSING